MGDSTRGCESKQMPWGIIGEVDTQQGFMEEKVLVCEEVVNIMVGVAWNHPQEEYAGMNKSLQQ